MPLGSNHPNLKPARKGEVRNPEGKNGAPKGAPLTKVRKWMQHPREEVQRAYDRGKGNCWDALAMQLCLKATKGEWRAMKELLDREEGPIAQHQVHDFPHIREGIELSAAPSKVEVRAQAQRMLAELVERTGEAAPETVRALLEPDRLSVLPSLEVSPPPLPPDPSGPSPS